MPTPDKTEFAAGHALLEQAGIEICHPRRHAGIRSECSRLARRLTRGDHRVFGLVPADHDVAVPGAAIQLGVSLVELSGSTAAYLDANSHWPAFSLPEKPGNAEFATRWIRESLALLIPSASHRSSDAVPALKRQLSAARDIFEYLLVDLTGFDVLGELDGAVEQMDQLLLMARGGRSREPEILEHIAVLPREKLLGVLLVD